MNTVTLLVSLKTRFWPASTPVSQPLSVLSVEELGNRQCPYRLNLSNGLSYDGGDKDEKWRALGSAAEASPEPLDEAVVSCLNQGLMYYKIDRDYEMSQSNQYNRCLGTRSY